MVQFIPPGVRCRLNRHEPARGHVLWDGAHFVGSCRHCGNEVRREKHGVWRKDWMQA